MKNDKNNVNRRLHYTMASSLTPDDVGYERYKEYYEDKLKNNPKLRKKLRENFKTAASIVKTQAFNGAGFIQDQELRFFSREFNSRLWQHGLGSMPSAFRVMEGFFNWVSDLFYFELFKEEEHLFSFFDFVDFITSNKCSNSIEYFKENVEDEVIYNYNILNEVDEISFKTADSVEYFIGGVSLLKRGNEAYLMIIAGEKGDPHDFGKVVQDIPDKPLGETMGRSKSYIKPAEDLRKEAVCLFNKKDVWKVNLYLRIDLDTKTIDLRYIQKDAGNSFPTLTDDAGMLIASLQGVKNASDFIKKQIEEVNKYAAVFEIAYKCLHLPEYFDFYNEEVTHEEHPTGLFDAKRGRAKVIGGDPFHLDYFSRTKDIWVLDRGVSPSGKAFHLKKSELKMQRNGYWKQLEPGQIGRGKNGQDIHNRTWIEQTLTWYESVAERDVEVFIPSSVSQNSGYIYLLRNAAHQLDVFKIGLTTKTVEERAKQLSGTSAPDHFLVINRWFVSDCYLAEKLIHESLEEYRFNPSREFFKIDLETAISVISPIVKKVNTISPMQENQN